MDNFDPYNVFLAIATNIPQRLKTGFVVQGHKYIYIYKQDGLKISIYSYISKVAHRILIAGITRGLDQGHDSIH